MDIKKSILKIGTYLDDLGASVAKKTNSATIGAAVEGAIDTGLTGAAIGSIVGAIDDDESVGGGMIKGALIGGAIGGAMHGGISHHLQKNAVAGIDYSRARQNLAIAAQHKGLIDLKDLSKGKMNLATGEQTYNSMNDLQIAKYFAKFSYKEG